MSYKNSLAGLDLGGGKAVIIGDPRTDKTEALLRAYGRFVESLGGRYLTACDVGTYNADLDVVARETRFAHGRSEAYGGCGDSSVLTAYGVFQGMRAAAAAHAGARPRWPAGRSPSPASARSAPGSSATWSTTARTSSSPTSTRRRSRGCRRRYPQVQAAADTAELVATPHDVYAPCALGGALDEETVALLPARHRLRRRQQPARAPRRSPSSCATRGILYAPDYLVNAGGVIQVEDERHGFSLRPGAVQGQRHLRRRAAGFRAADDEGVSPAVAADRLARGADPAPSAASPRIRLPTDGARTPAREGRVPVADPCRKVVQDIVTQSGSPRGPSSPELGSRTP